MIGVKKGKKIYFDKRGAKYGNISAERSRNKVFAKTLYWTAHAKGKMMQYRLSEARVKRILHSPERVETGIAPETIAVMQTQKGPKNSHEIWAMVADDKVRRRIISAWRYPGKTKPGESLPREILREFSSGLAFLRQG